jgi:Fe-S cluster assembly protein SufD
MTETVTEPTPLLSGLRPAQQALAGSGPDWLRAMRRQGLDRFESLGLPTPRDEEWRNTNLSPIVGTRFDSPAERVATDLALRGIDWLSDVAARLVFIDGRFCAERSDLSSLPEGVRVGAISSLLVGDEVDELRRHLGSVVRDEPTPFEALNASVLQDGAAIFVAEGAVLETPIQIVYASRGGELPTVTHPRTLVVAHPRSRVRLVELFTGEAGAVYLTNAVSEVLVADSATVEHYRLQLESAEAYHVSTFVSRQGRDSRYVNHNLNFGGRLVRHNVRGVLDGEGGYADLLGLYMPRGRQHVDNHTVLDHAAAHCGSREVYKGILDDRARSVFKGRIIVREGSQQTDAKQSNRNLLLSSEALAHTRPQLEIYADDVKCTHGATVGRLDEDAIFYLRSRGVPEDEARRLMIRAFAGEVLARVEIDSLRDGLEAEVVRRLNGHEG